MTNENIAKLFDGAPESAIGALIARPCCIHHPQVTFVAEMRPYGSMLRGESCDGIPLSAPSEFWEWVERPALQWDGAGSPPVGALVTIDCMGLEIWPQAKCLIGPNVRVLATYRAGDTDMIVVDSEDGCFNVCFRASMARPAKTPEQIAAEQRAAAIKTMVAACPCPGSRSTHINCEALYDAGYRKPNGVCE